jgi:hypothetical protein
MQPKIGGSFAPPLDLEKLARYHELAQQAGGAVGDVMAKLCDMVEAFEQSPRSTRAGSPHPSGAGLMVPLSEAEIKRLWEYVPWGWECDAYAKLFDEIDPRTKKELRNAAHHLLWFARELERDREPMTTDRL